jgi:hypothetical protein
VTTEVAEFSLQTEVPSSLAREEAKRCSSLSWFLKESWGHSQEVFMNLLQSILNTQNGDAVRHLAQNFGQGDQTVSALSNLIPALSQGLKQNLLQRRVAGSVVSVG